MTTAALLAMKKRPSADAGETPLEWIVTNGLGGYASCSVDGVVRRRFHGMLVSAEPAPAGRVMLLHALEVTLELGDGTSLSLGNLRGAEHGWAKSDFWLQAGLPHWLFETKDGLVIEQAVMMPHDQNTVHVRFCIAGDARDARLVVSPWLDFRPHEALLTTHPYEYRVTTAGSGRVEFSASGSTSVLRMHGSAPSARFAPQARDWTGVEYAIERDRGYDCVGAMHSPGTFSFPIVDMDEINVSASSESWQHFDSLPAAEAWKLELSRREHILVNSDPALHAADTFLLPLALDQFVIRPVARVVEEAQARAAGAEPRTVIAGYPWFTDWGRDTMISLEGLTLVNGRHQEARDILATFALHVRDGLIPNLFPEGERQGLYHTADATLWFFHALDRYDSITGDHSLVVELLPTLEEIIRHHQQGTLFNIHVDRDGLLSQGAEGYQLTWMDAKVDDWVVTPRRGKTVEINALWHNALSLLESWLVRAGRGMLSEDVARAARRCRDSFNSRFWNPTRGYLNDIVDGEKGDDDACRPNQIVAVAVGRSPLDQKFWKPVVERVAAELLTPFGLRTLSPKNPDYKAKYFGDLRARDAAYHQGTVWPWLLGPFIDAWIAVHPEDADGVKRMVTPLVRHVTDSGCVGSVSEIFDAEAPFTPRGCFAQAWSVAELSRVIVKLSGIQPMPTLAQSVPTVAAANS